MAVTEQYSNQLERVPGAPTSLLDPADHKAHLRVAYFDFTQNGVGDALSTATLVELPAGKVRVFAGMSWVAHSAFGASRLLNLGHDGVTASDGTTAPADFDSLHSAANVASAGGFIPMDETGRGRMLSYESVEPVRIIAEINGGTIPNGATLEGFIVYAVD